MFSTTRNDLNSHSMLHPTRMYSVNTYLGGYYRAGCFAWKTIVYTLLFSRAIVHNHRIRIARDPETIKVSPVPVQIG